MAEQQHADESQPGLEMGRRMESQRPSPAAKLVAADPMEKLSSTPAKEKKLTSEEQMALYEKDLKENDWGHQPC